MSRAYRITVKESVTRELKGEDSISCKLEVLEILPPEQMAELLKNELENRGYENQKDGTLVRNDGNTTITIEPCTGEVTVTSILEESIPLEARREATGYDDVGPGERSIRERVKEQLKEDIERRSQKESERLQTQATQELERKLSDLQPELNDIVGKITREALKQKAASLGTITEISEDGESGNMTIKIEV